MQKLTPKDRVEQFKRDLRSMHYYEQCIKELDLKLEEINTKLIAVSSPRPKEIIAGKCSAHYYSGSKVELILEEEELIKRRNSYVTQLDIINEKLQFVDSQNLQLLKDLYVRRVPYDVVADSMNMSKGSLKYYVNKLIENICDII